MANTATEKIRKARVEDIPRIIDLLHQVNMVHYYCRPDLFKPNTTKYNEAQLEDIIADDRTPVFVYDDGGVIGYAFGQIEEVKDDLLLQDMRTMYVDDICVDEQSRGKHVGKALYEYIRDYARLVGCQTLTLNVWEGNDSALSFYRNMGMEVRKTCMEERLVN